MSDKTREMIEDIANLVAIRMIRPLENRLTALETRMMAKQKNEQKRSALFWKIVTLAFAIPSFVIALLNLLS